MVYGRVRHTRLCQFLVTNCNCSCASDKCVCASRRHRRRRCHHRIVTIVKKRTEPNQRQKAIEKMQSDRNERAFSDPIQNPNPMQASSALQNDYHLP